MLLNLYINIRNRYLLDSFMKRGVSDIIAALILILIAASLGLSLYLFFSVQFSTQLENLSRSIEYYQTKLSTRFKATWYSYNTSTNSFKIFVYNYGDTVVKIDSIYINGDRYTLTPPVTILIGDIEVINLNITLTEGNYRIRLVTVEGVAYDFEVEI